MALGFRNMRLELDEGGSSVCRGIDKRMGVSQASVVCLTDLCDEGA
jgi:hypothetical protein